jgi:hypothetical protein
MKNFKVLLMVFLFAFIVFEAQAQKADKEKVKETRKEMKAERIPLKKLEGNVVSSEAKRNFNADFARATDVQWLRKGEFDEVSFTYNNKKLKGYYDSEGKLVGTTQDATFAEIPAKGQEEIKTKYKDSTIGPVVFFDDNELNETDMILWAVQFDDKDLYFVELIKGMSKIIVMCNLEGQVTFFKQL